MEFKEMGLDARLLHNVERLGYLSPTQIQSRAIPVVLQGSDVLGQAQTGTGKTAAFVLPIVNGLLKEKRGPVRALIIAPTRELAEQIDTSIGELARGTGIRSVTIYGGVRINPQVQALKGRPDIVVACPGRLLDHMRSGTIDLRGLKVLVLDEADRMLDMGFLPDIRRLIESIPRDRQTLLFSATLDREIKQLSYDFMRDPVSVDVGFNAPVETVSHSIFPVTNNLKTDLLLELLGRTDAGSVMIFTRTKHRARKVARQLQDAGFKAACLQGNLSQNKRKEALDGFRNGRYQILVATDIAARGIDVSTVSHVINYDMPDTVDAYTHRIGRTGRVDRTGDAFTLVTYEDDLMVRTIERVVGYPLERRTVEGFDYGSMPVKRNEDPSSPRHIRRSDRSVRGSTRSAPMRKSFRETRTLYQSIHR